MSDPPDAWLGARGSRPYKMGRASCHMTCAWWGSSLAFFPLHRAHLPPFSLPLSLGLSRRRTKRKQLVWTALKLYSCQHIHHLCQQRRRHRDAATKPPPAYFGRLIGNDLAHCRAELGPGTLEQPHTAANPHPRRQATESTTLLFSPSSDTLVHSPRGLLYLCIGLPTNNTQLRTCYCLSDIIRDDCAVQNTTPAHTSRSRHIPQLPRQRSVFADPSHYRHSSPRLHTFR